MDQESAIYRKKTGVHCMLPRWLVNLLPTSGFWIGKEYISRRDLFWAAAINGAQRGIEAVVGQVSFENGFLINVKFRSEREIELIHNFARSLYMSKPASVLRTAIMLGLRLPRVEEGIMSQIRTELFTHRELRDIWASAISWLNENMKEVASA
jgi:hypothetical protein